MGETTDAFRMLVGILQRKKLLVSLDGRIMLTHSSSAAGLPPTPPNLAVH
jgi:hypothetical protein